MSEVTNQLVGKNGKRRLGFGGGAVLTTALAAAVILHEGTGHAANVPSPLDDSSVAALTALDREVESVTARVEPAVVNVQVTSRGSEEETASNGQDQQIPPGLAQFFGPNGPFGGFGGDGQGQGRRFQREQRPLEHGVGSGV